MRKCPVVLMILVVTLFIIPSCQEKSNVETAISQNESIKSGVAVAEIVGVSGKCNIRVSPKLEILSVVQYLADDPVIRKNGYDEKTAKYAKDIENYFSSFKDEPVVSMYKEMRNNKFSYGRVPELILRIDDTFKIKEDYYNIDDYIQKTGNSKESLSEFLQLLSKFYFTIHFDEFYKSHSEYYNDIILDVKSKVDKTNFVEKLVKYYGYEQNSYNIVLYPLSNGGFAERIPVKNEKFDVYDFMTVPNNEISFAQLLIHEFGHSYTGPLTYMSTDELSKYSRLYKPIEQLMKKQNYNNWINCVDEHVVRAITNKILYDIYGNEVSRKNFEENNKNGFIYIDALCQRLEEYEKNRDKYTKFNDFYPEIIKVFEELYK